MSEEIQTEESIERQALAFKTEEEKAKPDYKTLMGIQKHPLYALLTCKQQMFLFKYLQTDGDKEAACIYASYGGAAIDVLATRVLRNAYVRKLVAVFYGYDVDETQISKKELLGLIAARLRHKDAEDRQFVDLTNLYLKLKRKRRRVQTSEEQMEPAEMEQKAVPILNDLVLQIERERREQKEKEYEQRHSEREEEIE